MADFAAIVPWVPLIVEVCASTGEDRWRFAAMGWQESRWGDALTPWNDPCGTGDGGHGRGLFQIDDRYHRAFVDSAAFRDPLKQALYACRILRDARQWFKRSTLNTQDPERLERMVYAAYNCGPAKVRTHLVLGHDVDAGTTRKNYSARVWRTAAELQKTMPNLFDVPQPAPVPEPEIVKCGGDA